MATEASKHKQQVASLEKATKEEKVKILQDFQATFKSANYSNPEVVKDVFQKSNLLAILATLLEENKAAWAKDWPKWVDGLMGGLSNVSAVKGLFPADQVRTLSNTFRKYILASNLTALHAYSLFACFDDVQQLLLEDNSVTYIYTLKKDIKNEDVLQFFYNLTSNEAWQRKLLGDKQLIQDLLALPESEDVWDLFVNLAYNEDAKELLPRAVLTKANNSSYVRCTDLSALLCNDEDLNTLKLNDSWIDRTANLLNALLIEGQVTANGTSYDLLDLILPITNLSAVLSKQEALGKRLIPLLLKVVTADLPQTFPVQDKLQRGRFEAACALWNLVYLESNRNIVNLDNGAAKLKAALPKSADNAKLWKAIDGILYMLSAPFRAPPQQTSGPIAGHVMLSYNWGSQPIVIRIAKSLKDLGYKVWLDTEQMKGDTLEAMANAIEQADMVLICMTQKYKDSANCRLEGEYCMNRKVEFVPLMMQQGYRPDGWLGITLGSRLWYDFSDDKEWDKKIAELVKAIGNHGKGTTVRQVGTSPPPPVPAAPARKPVAEWSLDEIQEWLKSEKIDHHFEALKKHKFDGKALVELKALLLPPNPSFLSYVSDLLKITELGETLRLFAAIRRL